MKKILNSQKQIKKYNQGQVLESIKALADQTRQAWQEALKVKLPVHYKKADKIVLSGMGGSEIGCDLLRHILADRLKKSITIISGYRLPKFVDKKTLFISSSYSGNTEETVISTKKALKEKAKVLIITTGGKLEKLAKKNNIPAYIFKPFFNPSKQPRLALGYSAGALMQFLRRLQFLDIKKREIVKCLSFVEKESLKFTAKKVFDKNPAKKLASKIHKTVPVLLTSNDFLGNAHVLANQLHENAKNFAFYYALPEINHHLMEGLAHPSFLKRFLFIFLRSNLLPSRLEKRFKITKKVFRKQGLKSININLKGKNKLEQSLYLLSLGSFSSFYLAVLNKEKPEEIPWVNFFKEQLSK